jgi:hypothetical protein
MDYSTEFSMDRRPRKRAKLAWEHPQTHSKVSPFTFSIINFIFFTILNKNFVFWGKSTVIVISKKNKKIRILRVLNLGLLLYFMLLLHYFIEEKLEIGLCFFSGTYHA